MNAFTIYLTFTIINQPLRTLFTHSIIQPVFFASLLSVLASGHCMDFCPYDKVKYQSCETKLNMHTNFKFSAHTVHYIKWFWFRLIRFWAQYVPTPSCPCNVMLVVLYCIVWCCVTFLSIFIFHRLDSYEWNSKLFDVVVPKSDREWWNFPVLNRLLSKCCCFFLLISYTYFYV